MQQAACSALLAAGSSARLALHRLCLRCTKTFACGVITGASSLPDFPASPPSPLLATPPVVFYALWVHATMGQELWRQLRITLQMGIWRSHMKVCGGQLLARQHLLPAVLWRPPLNLFILAAWKVEDSLFLLCTRDSFPPSRETTAAILSFFLQVTP